MEGSQRLTAGCERRGEGGTHARASTAEAHGAPFDCLLLLLLLLVLVLGASLAITLERCVKTPKTKGQPLEDGWKKDRQPASCGRRVEGVGDSPETGRTHSSTGARSAAERRAWRRGSWACARARRSSFFGKKGRGDG